MTNQIQVVKRDGSKEPLNIDKIHNVVMAACNGINGVSASEVELASQLKFFDGIKTTEIQETLIKAAQELISDERPNYQYVAGRLVNYQIRKEVFGQYTPPTLYDQVKRVAENNYYTPELLDWYTEEEFNKMDSFIDHERDEDLTYIAMEQFRGKYLVQNRVNGQLYETPQFCYILIAATLFHDYPEDKRLKYVRDYYDLISKHYISLPTPVMAGVRTPVKQFSSCVTINTGDSLDSINAVASGIVKYVSQKAGIGINAGRIRALGSPVRNGDVSHTGIIPFLKYFYAATKSCSQGGVRDGAANVCFPIWHFEVENLIVLKNNKGTEETRVRHMDYTVQFSKLFYERFLNNQDITLFCPNDVPEMYEAFFSNEEKFKELYEKAERNTRIRKKKVKARDLFQDVMKERKDTGRIYISNVDNVNSQGAYLPEMAPVYQTNLCVEIAIPNDPMGTPEESIGLCTLSAINWGKIDSPEDFKKPCDLVIRGLDALLDYQNYPVHAAEKHTRWYRPLGVGITNLAYWLAKNNLSYEGNKETYEMVDEYAEAWSYYLIRASVDLAKEKGACERSKDYTKYGKGICPIDTYNKNVDKIVNRKLSMDWENLKDDLLQYGIRNSVVTAQMPCETSSTILNSTNGIEPPRGFISRKQSKSGKFPQVVPGYPRLKNKYQLLWDIKSPEGYLNICAILQKYIDQAMSVNTSYNPTHYPNNEIPMSLLMKHLLQFYKNGGKNLYYNNTLDDAKEEDVESPVLETEEVSTESGCEGGACTL